MYYDLNLSFLKIFCSNHQLGCYCRPDYNVDYLVPSLIYNACRLELASVLMLEDVNKF